MPTLRSRNGLRAGWILLVAAIGLSIVAARAQDATDAGEQVQKLEKQITADGDRAKPELLRDLANVRTRAAFDALTRIYDVFQTIFMKREVVRVLPTFDGIGEAEQAALQFLMDVATSNPEPEMREAALDGLGDARNHGKDFLRMIVVSPAEDSVREKAMQLHVANAKDSDLAWYRELYKPKAEEKTKEEKEREKHKPKPPKKAAGKDAPKDDEPKPKRVIALDTIRLMAFGALTKSLTPEELVDAVTNDRSGKVRNLALEELDHRGDKKVGELARDVLKDPNLPDANRVTAARIVARVEGVKAAPDLIKRAVNADTPTELRRGLALILAAFNDANVNRDLIQELGKGSARERLFQMYAVRELKDDRVDKALVKMLSDKEEQVVVECARVLAQRKAKDAVPALQKLFEKAPSKPIQRAALDALNEIRATDPAWPDQLAALAKSPDLEVRSLAIRALGDLGNQAHFDDIVKALEDPMWSTRLAALGALEKMRSPAAVGAIVARMDKEDGRMLDEFAGALWRLTGQSFQSDAKNWQTWWAANGATFHTLSDAELARLKERRDEWRLRQVTRVATKFFGIRITSHRVIFIIDVSGSMDETLSNPYQGKEGAKRIDVARNELKTAVESLEPTAMFNILPFSSGVDRWMEKGLATADDAHRAEAAQYVMALKPGGGTNLYDAVKEAFADQEVDTIFIMSDGEPSVGEIVEPPLIRETVAAWNENRQVVINTISIGGKFSILEWLAEDSGGVNVKFE